MSPTVLFVDDEPSLLEGIRRALRREPYKIRCAASPAEALGLMTREPVDVVVSDEHMPGMSGSDFLARLRRDYPETIRMMLTGRATLDAAVRAINEGRVYHFFTKPCNTVELAMTIRHALRGKDLVRQCRDLLKLVDRQTALVRSIEHRFPGITHVERDAAGAVVLEDLGADVRTLTDQIGEEVKRCERLFAAEA